MLKRIHNFHQFNILLFYGLLGSYVLADPTLTCVNNAKFSNDQLYKTFSKNVDTPKSIFALAELNEYVTATEKKEESNTEGNKPGWCDSSGMGKNFGDAFGFISDLIAKGKESLIKAITYPVDLSKEKIVKISKKYVPNDNIKLECIENALKRDTGGTGYYCDLVKNKRNLPVLQLKSYGSYRGQNKQCFTQEMTKFTHFIINSAIDCLGENHKIDSSAIFRKFNNESGFNFSLANIGGVGLAQLTSPAIGDMKDKEITFGRDLLEGISKSENPKCMAFKKIAEKDLKSPPAVNPENYCRWINPGNGIARSAIYALGYYLVLKERYLIPRLRASFPKLAGNKRLINKLVAVAYSSEGLKEVYKFLYRNRLEDKSAKTIEAELDKQSQYLKNIKSKMREVLCLKKNIDPVSESCKNEKFTEAELLAEDCIGGET